MLIILSLALSVAAVIAENIPEELRRLPQWALWKFLPGKAKLGNPNPKPRKVPFWKRNCPASSTDSRTWSEFEPVLDEYLVRRNWWDGILFALADKNGITFIDADDAYLSDAAEIAPWAAGLQTHFRDTYQEASVSDTGFHILCHAHAPHCGQWPIHRGETEIGKVEVYDRARFVVMTGITGQDMPSILTDHQSDVERLVTTLDAAKARREARHSHSGSPTGSSFPPTSESIIAPGHRHRELVRRAGYLWKAGLAPDEVERKLIEINSMLCGGHYPDSHIRQIVRSAMRWSR